MPKARVRGFRGLGFRGLGFWVLSWGNSGISIWAGGGDSAGLFLLELGDLGCSFCGSFSILAKFLIYL